MNTGIQDAYNLGWKLTAVLRGCDAKLLDTYQEERLPIAAWVLGLSTELMNAAAKTLTLQFRRDEQTLQLGLNYRHSSLSVDTHPERDGLRAGDRAPEAPGLEGPLGECRMFDLLRGSHWIVIGMGTRWVDVIRAVTAAQENVKGYVIGSERNDGSHYFDRDGHAAAVYGDSNLFIIRPDNYVGLVTDIADANQIREYLNNYATLTL
jgi:hypothetical protein